MRFQICFWRAQDELSIVESIQIVPVPIARSCKWNEGVPHSSVGGSNRKSGGSVARRKFGTFCSSHITTYFLLSSIVLELQCID